MLFYLNNMIMKVKVFFFALFSAIMFVSCGSSKAQLESYTRYDGDGRQQKSVLRESNPVLRLVNDKNATSLRAAQSSRSMLEDVALENAENAAVQALASRIESAVEGVRERFNENNQIDNKTLTEQQIRNLITTKIKQRVSYNIVGEPAIYDNTDGSVTVWICVELSKPTDKFLSDLYDDLTKDDVIGIDYRRDKFIQDIKEGMRK